MCEKPYFSTRSVVVQREAVRPSEESRAWAGKRRSTCGCAVQAPLNQQEDKPSTGLNILAFLFPLVGLILFLCFQKTTPVRAKAIGKWALIGFIVGVALSILSGVLGALAS